MTILEVFTLLSIYRQIPLTWPVTFAEGLLVGIYIYLSTLFLPGYMGWKSTDFARRPNGVGIYPRVFGFYTYGLLSVHTLHFIVMLKI